jgi:hypothetical protein
VGLIPSTNPAKIATRQTSKTSSHGKVLRPVRTKFFSVKSCRINEIGCAGNLTIKAPTQSNPCVDLLLTLGRDPRAIDIWNTKLPLKIQIFLWMMHHDRLQTAVQLRNRKWDDPKECKLCGVLKISTICSSAAPLPILSGAGCEMCWVGTLFRPL